MESTNIVASKSYFTDKKPRQIASELVTGSLTITDVPITIHPLLLSPLSAMKKEATFSGKITLANNISNLIKSLHLSAIPLENNEYQPCTPPMLMTSKIKSREFLDQYDSQTSEYFYNLEKERLIEIRNSELDDLRSRQNSELKKNSSIAKKNRSSSATITLRSIKNPQLSTKSNASLLEELEQKRRMRERNDALTRQRNKVIAAQQEEMKTLQLHWHGELERFERNKQLRKPKHMKTLRSFSKTAPI
ncbi:hypothetical protein GPJ56_001347 [Histomonas meleagridis]|uniref:uncharacterized protein n=1 Tax=Histomonas meleagridis TaxID=135588 RepID=UPI00355AA0D5|nr:hypothetical protein GPJ56_001347 [Histomonas meleagridis]KAH0805103.1 hypothetical protein GO595_002048 [Histomonas meleagridis]